MTTPHSDRDLRQRVRTELDQEPSLDAEAIRIAVHEGVVTLSGAVVSCAQKHAVEHMLCRLPGVKGVANEVTVELPPEHERTDRALAQVALDELDHTVQVPSETIDVRVQDGCITLEGTVDWDFQRRRAERALRYLIGVKSINNLLTVRKHSTPADLKQRIRQALDRRISGNGHRVRVTVEDGAVTVSGTVPSWTVRDDIEDLLWSTPGVTNVNNNLDVSRTAYA